MPTLRHSLLLLEDDPSLARFVQCALEDLPLTWYVCATVAQARQRLAQERIDVLLTDLNLPDGNGLDLLQVPGIPPHTIVLSGGLSAAHAPPLQAQGVWRVLHKPVSVGALLATVQEALHSLCPSPPSTSDLNSDPVATFFGGNRTLFDAWSATSLPQLRTDITAGDQALHHGNPVALQHMAHNLKSALLLLGCRDAAQTARETEHCAALGLSAALTAHWQKLRGQVLEILQR